MANEKEMIIIPTDELYEAGERGRTFKSVSELAAFFKLSYKSMRKVIKAREQSEKPYRGWYIEELA